MTTTIIVAIVAVVVALLIAVPVTCKVAVNNQSTEGCRELLAQQKTEQEAS